MGLEDRYIEAIEEIERYYAFPKKHKEFMKIMPLVKNGIFLLFGPYGYGKTLYSKLISKVLFNGDIGQINLNSELTIHDVFFWVDIGQLAKGKEVIEPRKIITEPFKFINELQRGNGRIYNTLLSLMSEHEVVYRDMKFETPDFLMFLDSNPFDSASVEIPRALLDRITGSFTMITPAEADREKLMYLEHLSPLDVVENVMNYADMQRIWEEVSRVNVPESLKFLLIHLIHNYLNACIYVEKEYVSPETLRELCRTCRWRHEPCSELLEPMGQRWWVDVVRIAKARAYFEDRKEVTQEDMFFAIPYVLGHRVHLREDIQLTYRSSELWAEKLVKRIRTEMISRWLPGLNGNKKALKDAERTLRFVNEGGTE